MKMILGNALRVFKEMYWKDFRKEKLEARRKFAEMVVMAYYYVNMVY